MIYKKVQFLLLHTALLLCGVFIQSINAQCVTSGAQSIPDNGTLTIEFLVSGLTDSDLASPTQGICGVELDFMHENLGDLTVFLISPAGTIVQLIGPVTPILVSTNLSRWNISFLPCLTPVTPDAGFTDIWSNEQNWLNFTPYSGSYHPNVGCLENFSVGSANGLWRLVVQDHDITQVGTVTSASLIFCNPSGLQCAECNPIAGILSPAIVSLCEGTAFNSSSISVDYGGPAPPVSLYSYMYLLINGNSIINNGSSFSASPPAGSYSICGLSYLTADSMAIDMLVDAGDYNQLAQAINAGSVCGQLTSTCIDFDVLAIPDTVFIDRNLCEGESFSFRGQVYSSTGIYEQTVNGPGSCDSVYVLDITISSLNVMTNSPGVLDCASGSIVLNATVTGNNGPIQYQWSTNTGNIIGSTTTDQIVINQPGHYIVMVNDGQCVVSSEVDVVADDNFPKIFLDGGTLTCTQTSVHLSPIYVPTNGTLSWTGPMGFSSNQADVDVSLPGTYIVTVHNDFGCQTSKAVEVFIDTATRNLIVIQTGKDCAAQNEFYQVTDLNGVMTLHWTGPNNYSSPLHEAVVNEPGIYTLIATFNNGCQSSTSFAVDADFVIPDIVISPDDTLNCNETISLSVSSSTPGATYSWSGPGGYSSNQSMISVGQDGSYFATVHSTNECIAQGMVNIIKGNDLFNYTFITDTLDCKTDTVLVSVLAPQADLFHWINFPGADSLQSSILVTTAGSYQVIMTDTQSGCVIKASVYVPSYYPYPYFGISVETITCDNPVSELNFIPRPQFVYTDIYWELPDATIVQGTTLFSDLPGEHRLYGINPAGCIGIFPIHIPFDTLPPVYFLEADSIGCDLAGEIETILFDPLASILWTGPNMFSSSDFNPMISDTGVYVATGFGENGCSTDVSVYVEADFNLPLASIQADSLDCLSSFARLEVSSPEPILSYQWTDPFGAVISTDTFANVILPGVYIVQLEGTNHCFRADTIIVLPVEYPQIRVESDTLTCREVSIPIEATSDIPNPVFEWTDLAGTSLGNSGILNVTHSGPFIISVTGTNGCESRDTIRVAIDTVPPVAIISMQGEVRCQFRGFVLSGANSNPPQVDFEWSTLAGFITSNNLLPVINARDTGLYVLQIERHDNGCTDTAQIQVNEDPNSITMAFLDIIQASCAGDSNGQIHIVALQGGVLPVFSQLDGGPPQAVGLFQGLTAGTYNLEITDAEGCKYDTMVTIVPTNPFQVDAGPDQEIYLGESFELSGTSDINVDQIIIQEWDSLGFIFCQDCPLLEVTPLMTTTYIYRIISATGCILEDEVTIFVIEKGKFYIANVFTPNGDNINDEIRINAVPGIKKVRKWIIYDRWGDAVFGATDFDPDDLSIFWNGKTSDGEVLNPAVFPYMLEVVLINGNTEVHHGTITLIK